MIVKRCDKCGQDVDELRRFRIHEVDVDSGNIYATSNHVRLRTSLGFKLADLDLCESCASGMGFELGAALKIEKPIEDVFRAFIEAIVEDMVAEHSHEE